jgi:hypothetical protein
MKDTNELLAELVKWTKVTSYRQVKETLETVLVKPEDRLVYHLSDGGRTGLQIAKESGVRNARVSNLQSGWTKMGLAVKTDTGYRKEFALEDFDLDVPATGPKRERDK